MATSAITLSASKARHSLMMSINVGSGTAQLRRNLGLFSANYSSTTSITEMYIELASGESYVGTATNALFVYTTEPVRVVGSFEAPTPDLLFIVNRMSFTDQLFTSFSVTNIQATPVSVHLVYSAPVPGQTAIIQPSVLSVNGNLPDASGNVTVDTGVMTVNSIVPGSQGIPGDVNVTDEGII